MASNNGDFAQPLAGLVQQQQVQVSTAVTGGVADVQKDGTTVDAEIRSRINFITGTGMSLTVADNAGSDRVDVTIQTANPLTDKTLGTAAANIDITSIPSTYAVLHLVLRARSNSTNAFDALGLRVNGITASDYSYQTARFAGTTATVTQSDSSNSWIVGSIPGVGSGGQGICHIWIPNYADTTLATHEFLSDSSAANNTGTNNNRREVVGGWIATGSAFAINEITLIPASGSFIAGTRLTIYGL